MGLRKSARIPTAEYAIRKTQENFKGLKSLACNLVNAGGVSFLWGEA